MFNNPIAFLIGSLFLIPAILIAIPVHELGHGIAAHFAGDPSPRNRGYLAFRPRLFINIYGVLLAFLANVSFGTPIPVNEYRLQGVGRKLLHALGGPAANLLVAIVFGIAVRALEAAGGFPSFATQIQPPIVYVTQLVSEVRLDAWVLMMSPVLAPAQAAWTKVQRCPSRSSAV